MSGCYRDLSSGAGFNSGIMNCSNTGLAVANDASQGGSLRLQHGQQNSKRTEQEALSQIYTTLVETDDIATVTMGKLNDQTEQLQRIHEDTGAIDHNLDQTKYLLGGFKSAFSWVTNIVRKQPPPHREEKAFSTAPPRHARINPQAATVSTESRGFVPSASGASAPANAGFPCASCPIAEEYVCKKVDAKRPDQRAKVVDKQYADCERVLASMEHKTKEINRTLDVHNKLIPVISDDVQKAQERVSKQAQEMKMIAGRPTPTPTPNLRLKRKFLGRIMRKVFSQ